MPTRIPALLLGATVLLAATDVLAQSLGDPCPNGPADCGSAFPCVNGVCCEGTCITGVPVCDDGSMCGEDGRCMYPSDGEACGSTWCTGDADVGPRAGGNVANHGRCASGGCVQEIEECGEYLCDPSDGTCRTECTSGLDCASTAWCDGEEGCKPKGDVGAPCTENDACTGGKCVDGFCCNDACEGLCEACDVPDVEGACTPVVGEPHGTRESCPSLDDAGSGDDASPCGQLLCDGETRLVCAALVGPSVACREASCVAARATAPASCDGEGYCPEAEVSACAPYACDGTSCGTSCQTSAQCAPGYTCSAARCIGTGSTCQGDRVIAASGAVTECTPYGCDPEQGACRAACTSNLDCAAGFTCHVGTADTDGTAAASVGVCADPPEDDPAGAAAGCGPACSASGASGRAAPGALVLFLLLAAKRAGRRPRPEER